MATEEDALGGEKDSIKIEIDGQLVRIAEQYELQTSVLKQPGAFTLRIGGGQTAIELLSTIVPRKSRYRLFLNDVLTQSGIIYGCGVPGSSSTIIEVKGRDYMSVVYDAYVREEKSFHEKTYKEFTRRVLDEVGLTEAKGFKLITSNDVNRLKLTGRNVKASSHTVDGPSQPKSKASKAEQDKKAASLDEPLIFSFQASDQRQRDEERKRARERREIGEAQLQATINANASIEGNTVKGAFQPMIIAASQALNTPSSIVEQRKIDNLSTAAASGTSTVVVQTLKVELGTRWHDALERENKLSGLFIWAAADGSIILARPNATQSPSYRLYRQREDDSLTTNILEARFENDTTERHTSAIVYGRVGKGKAGRNKLRGEFVDTELSESNFDAPIVIHDNDIATQAQADYLARRTIAGERRAGWKLVYTVAGHTTNLISSADGATTNWAVDTVVEVDDRELGIQGNFYIESLSFKRDPKTTTEITLMRPEDLLFAEDLFPKPVTVYKQIQKKNAGAADPATAPPTDQEGTP